MTEKLADRSESDRRKIIPEWGVAADDQIVLVAFLALFLILGTFAWNAWGPGGDDPSAVGVSLDDADTDGNRVERDGRNVDLSDVEATHGIDGRMNGSVAVLTGTVADDEARDAAGAAALAVDGVDRVDNRLRIDDQSEGTDGEPDAAPEDDGDVASEVTTTTEAPTTTAPPVAAAATVAADDDGISLTGTVPSEDMAEKLRAAALASYAQEQIDDQLVVDDEASSFDLTVSGTVGSQDTLDALTGAFAGVGADQLADELELDAATAVSAALNDLFELEPVLFESGTDVILADSLPTLDRAAEILADHPDASIQIGGHTDSRGGAEANLALSQARADAVVAALLERGVTNEMTAVGFGETQLLVDPDDTPEAQQANRRIEFTPN